MAFLVSPGVNTSEIDLTTSIPAVSTTTGATVGFFRWGPANTVVQVGSESDMVSTFFKPDSNSSVSFLTATNFLSYGNDLRVVRVINPTIGTATTSTNATSNPTIGVVIPNEENFFNTLYGQATVESNTNVSFAARYPGMLGNSLKVSVCPATNASGSLTFANWPYATYFDAAPNTSPYAAAVTPRTNNPVRDEVHVVVVDEDGLFTGVANTVLERYPNLSKAVDAKGDDGASIYYREVLFRNSAYIYPYGHPDTANAVSSNSWGQTVAAVVSANTSFHGQNSVAAIATTYSMGSGNDGIPKHSDVIQAVDLFANKEKYDISLLFAGDCLASVNSSIDYTVVANEFITVADGRKDTVAFVSPSYANSVTSVQKATDMVAFRNQAGILSTSYAVMDSGWKYQYDKYNDRYRWIPLNADTAGLCARTDSQRDPWFSPAGMNRGQVKNLVKLSFNPSQSERDTLYKAGVNPVVSFPGEGTVLFGDKTLQGRPSAFDRINVRRLFIVLEKAIARASRSSLFEFNDEFTRAQFVSLVEPFLREVQGRRGIYDFRVVCDESNNTAEVIDANQFVGDIYIKPARSVNFIQLNFVAVRTGVSFDEIVGRF